MRLPKDPEDRCLHVLRYLGMCPDTSDKVEYLKSIFAIVEEEGFGRCLEQWTKSVSRVTSLSDMSKTI